MRILVSGATGFIGRRLCQVLHRRGDSVVALARDPIGARASLGEHARVVGWNPGSHGPWVEEVAHVDAIVNLAGEPVLGRWTHRHKQRVHDSRILTTRALVEAIGEADKHPEARLNARPRVLVQASATGFYGPTTRETDEKSPAGHDWLSKVCVDWEAEAARAETFGTKVVVLRIGVVLGADGGALPKMARAFKMFLGGRIGTGKQWISWVALDDVVGMIEMALDRDDVTGPINAVSPEPVQNQSFAKMLGDVLGRPSILPTPGAALQLLFGEGASIVTEGQCCVPTRAIELEYPFTHPSLRGALRAALRLEV